MHYEGSSARTFARRERISAGWCAPAVAALCLLAVPSVALAKGRHFWKPKPRYCSTTAQNQYAACHNEVRDDLFTGKAICINLSDPEDRYECLEEAREEWAEGRDLCRGQRAARLEVCAGLGEGRYDPDFDPDDFDDDFENLTNPNPYRPLGIGDQWKYEGGDVVQLVECNMDSRCSSLPAP